MVGLFLFGLWSSDRKDLTAVQLHFLECPARVCILATCEQHPALFGHVGLCSRTLAEAFCVYLTLTWYFILCLWERKHLLVDYFESVRSPEWFHGTPQPFMRIIFRHSMWIIQVEIHPAAQYTPRRLVFGLPIPRTRSSNVFFLSFWGHEVLLSSASGLVMYWLCMRQAGWGQGWSDLFRISIATWRRLAARTGAWAISTHASFGS